MSNREAAHRFAVTFIIPSIPVSEVFIEQANGGKVCLRKLEQTIENWFTNKFSSLKASRKRTDYAFVFPQLGNPYYNEDERYYPGVVIIFEERFRAHRRKTLAEE